MPNAEFDEFVAFRSRISDRLLKKLNGRKATGRDMISAAILKKLHDCIAVPFTRVVRRLFFEVLWLHLVKHIPRRQLDIVKQSHPWMSDRSKRAIVEKNLGEGTSGFKTASIKCAETLAEERCKHVQKVKDKMATLPPATKQWWKINRELLRHKATLSSIRTLREDGRWIKDAKDKADACARNFESKAQLPDELVDTPFFGCASDNIDHFF